MEDLNIKNWCTTIRQFNYFATRKTYAPDKEIARISETAPYGIFTHYVNSIGQYELFESELLTLISQSQHPEIILKKWSDEFMPSIRQFKKWFADHKQEIEIFGVYNPYKIMHDYILRTESELLRYEEAITGKKKHTPQLRDTLEKACIGPDQYQTLRQWFIENGLCNPDTFIWKDTKKGGKSILVNYLKDAHVQGYIYELKHAEIRVIAHSDFGTDISLDTIKRPGPNAGNVHLPPFKDQR